LNRFHSITTFTAYVTVCAKKILTAPTRELQRPPVCLHITWLTTVQRDLTAYNLTLNEAVDLAQNRLLWKTMCGTMHS